MTGSLVHNLGIHFNEDTQTSAWELGIDALQTSKLRALLLLDTYITLLHPALPCNPNAFISESLSGCTFSSFLQASP